MDDRWPIVYRQPYRALVIQADFVKSSVTQERGFSLAGEDISGSAILPRGDDSRVLGLAHLAIQRAFSLLAVREPKERTAPVAQETDLVVRARNMDPEAWDIIFNRYYPEIFAYLRYRTATLEDAEDLAATVFERAVRHIRSYKETGRGLGAWLQRIASNLVVDYYRRRSVPVRQAEPLPAKLEDPTMSPLEHALRVDTAEEVRRALAQLPESQQNVLIYRFLLGYNLAETAQIMGKSVNAIKALQHRALRRLREVWEQRLLDDTG